MPPSAVDSLLLENFFGFTIHYRSMLPLRTGSADHSWVVRMGRVIRRR